MFSTAQTDDQNTFSLEETSTTRHITRRTVNHSAAAHSADNYRPLPPTPSAKNMATYGAPGYGPPPAYNAPQPGYGPNGGYAAPPPPPPPQQGGQYGYGPAPAAGMSYDAAGYPQKPMHDPNYYATAPAPPPQPAPMYVPPHYASAPPGSFPQYKYAQDPNMMGAQQGYGAAPPTAASMPCMPTIVINNNSNSNNSNSNNTTTTTTQNTNSNNVTPVVVPNVTVVRNEKRYKSKAEERSEMFWSLFILGFFTLGIAWLFLWVPFFI